MEFLGHVFFLRGDRQECELHKQTDDTDGNHRKQETRQVSIDYACELASIYRTKPIKSGGKEVGNKNVDATGGRMWIFSGITQ